MNRDFLFRNEKTLIVQVISFFFSSVLDQNQFAKIVAICSANPDVVRDRRQHFIQKGQFSLKDFLHYWSVEIKPGGGLVPDILIQEIVKRLCEWHLLHRSELLVSYGLDIYHVNEPLAKFVIERDALENLVFDFPYLAAKYANSVLRLQVTDRAGDIWSGTGFLFAFKNWILTNKHVIGEAANGIPEVWTAGGRELPVGEIRVSPTNDLALIRIEELLDARPLYAFARIEPLDEIITLGFPRIPLALSCPSVAHKGECNGRITTSQGERLLFSAKTAPGNSGGPVINRAGLVVGIVTEDLQSKAATEMMVQPYYAAIPISQIAAFVQDSIALGAMSRPGTS